MGLFGILPHGILLNAAATIAGVMEEDNLLNNDKTGNEKMDKMKGGILENKDINKSIDNLSSSTDNKGSDVNNTNSKKANLSASKSDKEILAEKNAKAAIMARNMSHNLGSHVLSYTQRDIEGYIEQCIDNGNNIPLSYQRGIQHLLKYLQERQDFIATVATARVPYFLPLAFKETVFDFINPDYKANRHDKTKMVDNILLKHIARSESYGHTTPASVEDTQDSPEKVCEVLVSMYDRQNKRIVRGKDSKDELDFIRDKNYMFPGGVVGRHAIMSIVENLIRNAAKHEKVQGNLELVLELCTHEDLITKAISDEKVCQLYKDASDKEILDYLIFSYRVANLDKVDKTIDDIKIGLADPYCDDHQNTIGKYKGIKEIRISASWLRGEIDEDKYSKLQKTKNKDGQESDSADTEPKLAPLVYVQKKKIQDGDSENLYLQFIIGLRRALSLAIVKEGMNEVHVQEIKDLFGRDCLIYNSAEEYINDRFSNSAEYTLVATETIKKQIRMYSYERVLVIPQDVELCNSNCFLHEIAKLQLGESGISENIWIEDSSLTEDGEKEIINKVSIKEENEIVYEEGVDFRQEYRYLYKKHLDQNSEWETFIMLLNYDLYPNLRFIESLTGANSTDRLVRHTIHDTLWYCRQVYAMQKNIAIIDERLYDMVADAWQRALLLKLKGIYLYKIDEKTGFIEGFSSPTDYTKNQCITVGTIDISNGVEIKFDNTIGRPQFDYLSIHQGILDKLYDMTNKQKREVTDCMYESFTTRKASNVGEGFQEGLTIHSGRSKPESLNMPQKIPFIQYSALYDALFDCKYTLVNLLSYAKYD